MSSQRGSDPPARIFCHDYDEDDYSDDYSDENESGTRTNDHYSLQNDDHWNNNGDHEVDVTRGEKIEGRQGAVARHAAVVPLPPVRCLEAAEPAVGSVSPHYKDQVRPLCRDDKRRVKFGSNTAETAPNLVSSTNNTPTAVATVWPIAPPASARNVGMAVAVPMMADEPPYRADMVVGRDYTPSSCSYNSECNDAHLGIIGPAQAAAAASARAFPVLAADTQAVAAAPEAVAPDQAKNAAMKDETSPMDDDDDTIRETSEQNAYEVERQRRWRNAERFRMSATRIKMLYIQKSKQPHRRPSRQHMVATTTLWEDENDGGDSDIDVGTGRRRSSSANVDWELPMRSIQDTSQHNYDDFGGHDAKIGRLVEI